MFSKFLNKTINILPNGRSITATKALSSDYLRKEGWTTSVLRGRPLDTNGFELPWFTYGAIHFLTSRINKDQTVCEYGSGNSTIWFSKKVGKVLSIEHDQNWYHQTKDRISEESNIDYMLRDLDSGLYGTEILNYQKAFNVIVIDGRERITCTKNALGALKDDGVIIWDNSDRVEYAEAYSFLLSNGFKRIDFWGLGPINTYSWCTSIFYRANNCLKI